MSNVSTNPVSISYPSSYKTDNSWLAVIAKALAKCMTELQRRMMHDADKMSKLQTKESHHKLSKQEQEALNNAKTDLKVATQEYGMVVNSVNTVLQSIGQADTVLARSNR